MWFTPALGAVGVQTFKAARSHYCATHQSRTHRRMHHIHSHNATHQSLTHYTHLAPGSQQFRELHWWKEWHGAQRTLPHGFKWRTLCYLWSVEVGVNLHDPDLSRNVPATRCPNSIPPLTLPRPHRTPPQDRNYFLSSDNGCQKCSGRLAWLGPLIFFIVLTILGAAIMYNIARIKAWESRHHKWLVSFGQKLIGETGDSPSTTPLSLHTTIPSQQADHHHAQDEPREVSVVGGSTPAITFEPST